jgi:hypothetical protein
VPVLRISAEEARDLKLALEVQLHGLRVELAATDHKDYRAMVRSRLERLEAIAARIDSEIEAAARAPDK